MKLYPLEATAIGDTRYNDLLPVAFSASYIDTLQQFYKRYLAFIGRYDRENLNEKDQLSHDIFKRELEVNLEGLDYRDNYTPFNQFYGLPLSFAQLGSGEGMQPFKTVKDYEDWLSRIEKFAPWADSAVVYFKKGLATGYVLPASLVQKMIPQMQNLQSTPVKNSLFYGPLNKMPADFSATDKNRITDAYTRTIGEKIIPAYTRLATFLQTAYLPKARSSAGINALESGDKYYNYQIKAQTTTNKTPEEIYQTGLSEVARLRHLQDSVKQLVNFSGDLLQFFEFMKVDKQFMPYKSAGEILAAFEAIHKKITPNVEQMFNHQPKTPFEIRQTEAFRAATASAEYNPGSPDGSRPGIFYVPVLDPTTFNTTSGMESLFLHEAIPGHHFQISLQQEDTTLPKFRRFGGNNAYVEGWALYCESLGKSLGLYTDPYQYMAALGDEMHRAIRLVVDVAIHTKGMTREQAIDYMMQNEAASQQYATMEIERYMAIPGQALGYKIGALKIAALRAEAEKALGNKFNIAAFHDEVLKYGPMPLDILERRISDWIKSEGGK